MKDTITLPRQLVQDAVDSFRDHRLEYWDTRRCDTEKALRAALDAPAPNEDDEWCHCGKIECSYCHATAKRPDAPAPKVEPAHPTDLEKVIDDYIEYYEMHGESEDGRDAIYTPTENDKALLKDAILGLLVDTDWDAAWGAHIDSLVSARAAKIETWTDADADAARLALELECLLNDTADMSIVSKWWASSMEALDLHRARISAKPNTLKKLDAMERLLIARQQPAPTAQPQRVPLTEEQIDAIVLDGCKALAWETKAVMRRLVLEIEATSTKEAA